MSTVRIPTPLRKLTGDQRVVQADGATLVELVEDLDRRFPGIKARILDGDGRVHSFVNIFVDDQDVRFLQGLATPLREETEVAIVPAMAGGQMTSKIGMRGRPPKSELILRSGYHGHPPDQEKDTRLKCAHQIRRSPPD